MHIREKVKHILKKYPERIADFVEDLYGLYPVEVGEMVDELYHGCHIRDEKMYDKAVEFIKNSKDESINPWDVDDIIQIASNYIDVESQDYTNLDLALWANVKKGDYGNLESETAKIIKMAILDLSDKDYPFGEASERAYYWAKAIIKKENQE